jgi:hypothetical protein
MHKTDEVFELHTRQVWYECARCGVLHTVAERGDTLRPQRIGNAYRFSAPAQVRG